MEIEYQQYVKNLCIDGVEGGDIAPTEYENLEQVEHVFSRLDTNTVIKTDDGRIIVIRKYDILVYQERS
jgi:hypothetical protein